VISHGVHAYRFRKLLSDPFQKDGRIQLFPRQNQDPASERWRLETLSIVWQLRHTVAHNVGVITQSDAIKLRLLVRAPVPSMQILAPTRDDIHFLKRFLDETAEMSNRRMDAVGRAALDDPRGQSGLVRAPGDGGSAHADVRFRPQRRRDTGPVASSRLARAIAPARQQVRLPGLTNRFRRAGKPGRRDAVP
jgi:hypothetical protein